MRALCPCCQVDGRRHDPGFSAMPGDSQPFVLCCHGPGKCLAIVVLGSLGMSWADLNVETTATTPGRRLSKDKRQVSQTSHLPTQFNVGNTTVYYKRRNRTVAGVWTYLDEHGKPLHEVVRLEPGFGDKPKTFLQRLPEATRWGIGDVPRVLYNLPAVRWAVAEGKTIYFVEGEKCAEAINVHDSDTIGYVATTNPGGANSWRDEYADYLVGAQKVIVWRDKDNPGRQWARQIGESLARRGIPFEIVESPHSHDAADHLTAGHSLDEALIDEAAHRDDDLAANRVVVASPDEATNEAEAERPTIQVGTSIAEMTDAAEAALVDRPELGVFARGNVLVRVVRDTAQELRWLARAASMPCIVSARPPWLREQLDRAAQWSKASRPAIPPKDVVATLADRGEWKLPPLEGIVESPVFLPDGNVITEPGYDPRTGLLFIPAGGSFPQIQSRPTRDDARGACEMLLDSLVDFPFVAEADRAVVLAAILTLIARWSIQGPVPAFAFRSHTPGSGKTLLADFVAMIATGRDAPRMTSPRDDDEARKRIMALALAGAPLVLIDNVVGAFGSKSLAAALTAETWSDRVLGLSETRTVPLRAVWMVTGNNITFQGDLGRRVVLCDIQPPEEFPEDRTGFRYDPLLDHVRVVRKQLVAASLTILRAFHEAGRPEHGGPPKGSFEAWDRLVRACLIWAGGVDPLATAQRLRSEGDKDREALDAALQALTEQFQDAEFRAADAVEATRSSLTLLEALTNFAGCDVARLDARLLGYALRGALGRPVRGMKLDRRSGGHDNRVRWRVVGIRRE